MLAKNLPYPQLFWKIPFRFLLDIISAWKSLLAGQAIYFWAIGEAHLAFLKWVLVKRNQSIFPKQRRGQLDGWYKHSVAWKHFVRGKETFTEIVDTKS